MLKGGAAKARRAIKRPSIPQVKLWNLTKKIYPEAEIEYPCLNRSIDVAILEYMIAIEYDEPYWHPNKEEDDKRQRLIETKGWRFLRYAKIPSLQELKDDINNLLTN